MSVQARPIAMKRLWIGALGLTLACAMLLAGCGQEGRSSGPDEATPKSAECTLAPNADHAGLVSLDLDGDGTQETPVVLGGTGACANHLVVDVSGSTADLDLGTVTLEPKAHAIRLKGRTGDILVARQTHPRGGFQTHLYGYADGHLEEITVDGAPMLPFVATDTPPSPSVADCTSAGTVVFTVARAHTPPGVVYAWDLDETTYTITGNAAHKKGTRESRDNVLEKQLHTERPDLFAHEMFQSCRLD